MGQTESSTRSMYLKILKKLLHKKGIHFDQENLSDFLKFIQVISSWLPENGTLDASNWKKVEQDMKLRLKNHKDDGNDSAPENVIVYCYIVKQALTHAEITDLFDSSSTTVDVADAQQKSDSSGSDFDNLDFEDDFIVEKKATQYHDPDWSSTHRRPRLKEAKSKTTPRRSCLHAAMKKPVDRMIETRFISDIQPRNFTDDFKFLLLGLTEDAELQCLLYMLFLIMYLVTVLGNLLIVLAVSSDSHLYSPMYFFISILSITDICLSTTTIPNMLVNIQTQNKSITYTGCLCRMYFVLVFSGLENFLLAAMAYDRYVAICHPLRYTVIMNPSFCGLLILLSVFISKGNALIQSLMVLHLSFCRELKILQFFCELAQVLKASCSSTLINNIVIYFFACILGGIPLSGIIFSYTQIISSVLRIPSTGGKYKAFSTCGSHLSVVFLFYGTSTGVYISSVFSHSSINTAIASVMYVVVPQMMNPFIYSLRNKDIKVSLSELIGKISSFK
ncbi:PREDICTED: olfactory receptor 7G2-like [Chrysochloris asiatica]|uniref:Olfactory receptor 7G2-like n=1 Tax=Chrysochloris asiatica TaxID=185453 RepID=A0A9B0X126_CHRAS|nr:PREDICTED: olfactory receptor 7G2-like [Chrysochloris asiatica]